MAISRPQTQRKLVKKTLFQKVFSRTSRTHHASTATNADFDNDTPNQSVGRIILVILLLHFIAVSGMIIHSKINKQPTSSKEMGSRKAAPAAPVNPHAALAQAAPRTNPEAMKGHPVYRCQASDTYEIIAQNKGVDEAELRTLNNERGIYAGLELYLPKPKPLVVAQPAAATSDSPSESGQSYTIVKGDTLSRIAKKYQVTVDALQKLNQIKDPTKIRIGQAIKIPSK